MEINTYRILQNWHELLQKEVITNEEFLAKKNELLGEQKKREGVLSQQDIHVFTEEEQAEIDTEYEILFNNKSWFQKNKSWLIAFSIILLIGVGIWIFSPEENNSELLTLSNNLIESTEKASNRIKIKSKKLTSDNYRNETIVIDKSINSKVIEGSWLADKEDVFGLTFNNEDEKILCNWVLLMDCALSFSLEINNDTLFLYGEEFEGGNSFSDFFNSESVKRFNNGSLFCYATLVDQNNMEIHYVDNNFIKDLNDYLNGILSKTFPPILKKKQD